MAGFYGNHVETETGGWTLRDEDFPTSILEELNVEGQDRLEPNQRVPLAVAESIGDLGTSTYPTPVRSLEPLAEPSLRRFHKVPSLIWGSGDSSDDEASDDLAMARMPLKIMAAAITLFLLGILFLIVSVILSPRPLQEYPEYIIIGGMFVVVSLAAIITNVVWCRYMEKTRKKQLAAHKRTIYKIALADG